MKSELHKLLTESQMNEMGIRRVERLAGSHIGQQRQQTVDVQRRTANQPQRRSYEEVSIELRKALKNVTRREIRFENPAGSRNYYVMFPEEIVALMTELKAIDESRFISEFGRWRQAYPGNSDAIYFNTEGPSGFQRSHFPNGGIPPFLRNIKLGFKMYRALLATAGYLSSNSAGTREKDKTWGSLLSYKENPDGSPSDDDAHAVIGPANWMAIDKELRESTKISRAMDFIEQAVGFGNTRPDRFDIDDELLALLPDPFLSRLNRAYLTQLKDEGRLTPERFNAIRSATAEAERLEAERQEAREREEIARRAERERELRTRFASRISQYGADLDADWNVGDFVVVRDYLLQNYDTLPIRQVVHREGGTYYAAYIRDAIRIAQGQITYNNANDVRTTSTKANWVKVNIEDIADLDRVNLQPEEKRFIQDQLNPEVRAERERQRVAKERQQAEQDAQANADRSRNEQTYGPSIDSQTSFNDAVNNRQNLDNIRILNQFKSGNSVQVIAMTPQQAQASATRSTDVFVPCVLVGRTFRPVSLEQIRQNSNRIALINLVTGHTIAAPVSGLNLQYYVLNEVTRDDKRQVRGGDTFYVANHRNVFGLLSKAEYGTRNTSDQAFIYMNVFGRSQRSTAVRIDLLRKLSRPYSFTDLVDGGYENQ
jgi:hypothetical protein